MSFLENFEQSIFQDELPFFGGSNQKISNALNEVILDPENQKLMQRLADMEESNWENEGGPAINNLLESQTSFEE